MDFYCFSISIFFSYHKIKVTSEWEARFLELLLT